MSIVGHGDVRRCEVAKIGSSRFSLVRFVACTFSFEGYHHIVRRTR